MSFCIIIYGVVIIRDMILSGMLVGLSGTLFLGGF